MASYHYTTTTTTPYDESRERQARIDERATAIYCAGFVTVSTNSGMDNSREIRISWETAYKMAEGAEPARNRSLARAESARTRSLDTKEKT